MNQKRQEALRQIVLAVEEAIRDAGEIPSGHLYAALMGVMTLDQYNTIISVLKKAGKIEEKFNMLKYIG